EVELAVAHRPPRELAGLGEPRAAFDHGREQPAEVMRAAVAVQLGDILAGERTRRAHREREHLVEPLVSRARPGDAHASIEVGDPDELADDRDRARAAEPHDADPAYARRGR